MPSQLRSRITRPVRLLYGLSILLLVVLRDFCLLTNPRLVAEEASFFGSWTQRGLWPTDLMWAQVGYYDLIPVMTPALCLPSLGLAWYPAFAYGIALLVQLTPAFILAAADIPCLDRHVLTRLLLMLATVFFVPEDVVWISLLGAKFFLATVPRVIPNPNIAARSGSRASAGEIYCPRISAAQRAASRRASDEA